ncbi:PREDICTED: putative two-component response regulator ARR19, partial [Tarenaya hassleriana]
QALIAVRSRMDLPFIIMSTDHEREAVMKAMMYGACQYLVKPVNKETIAVLWQHIARKTRTRPVRPLTDQTAGSVRDKITTRAGEEENKGEETAASKKNRMTWTDDLHQKFLQAVNVIGIEKAVPKTILKCMQEMKVQGLSRNNVASHLQKYRLNLQ